MRAFDRMLVAGLLLVLVLGAVGFAVYRWRQLNRDTEMRQQFEVEREAWADTSARLRAQITVLERLEQKRDTVFKTRVVQYHAASAEVPKILEAVPDTGVRHALDSAFSHVTERADSAIAACSLVIQTCATRAALLQQQLVAADSIRSTEQRLYRADLATHTRDRWKGRREGAAVVLAVVAILRALF